MKRLILIAGVLIMLAIPSLSNASDGELLFINSDDSADQTKLVTSSNTTDNDWLAIFSRPDESGLGGSIIVFDSSITASGGNFVLKTGDTMSGNLTLEQDLIVDGTLYGGSPVKVAGGMTMIEGIYSGDGSGLFNLSIDTVTGNLNMSGSDIFNATWINSTFFGGTQIFLEDDGSNLPLLNMRTFDRNNSIDFSLSDGPQNNVLTISGVGSGDDTRIHIRAIDAEDASILLFSGDDSVSIEHTPSNNLDIQNNKAGEAIRFQYITSGSVVQRYNINDDDGAITSTTGTIDFSDNNVTSNGNISINHFYGEMWNYTSAGWVFDIDDADVYYNLTGLIAGELNGFNFVSNSQANGGSHLVTLVEGLYKLSFSMSFSSENVGGLYGFSIAHDYNPDTHRDCYARRAAATSTGNVGVTCIMNLHVGDQLAIMIENESTNRDMTIYTANLNILRVGDV